MAILKIAACLADPERNLQVNFDAKNIDVKNLITVLKKNKVPLAFLERKPDSPCQELFELDEFVDAINADRAYFNQIKTEYLNVKKRFQEKGIDDVLFKSTDHIP